MPPPILNPEGGKTSPADGDDSGESEGDAAIEEASTHARRHDDASRVTTTLRFIDGAIASNNPTAVGVFEARRLFPRDRKLCVVSVGTGAALPREVPGTGYAQSQAVSNLIAAPVPTDTTHSFLSRGKSLLASNTPTAVGLLLAMAPSMKRSVVVTLLASSCLVAACVLVSSIATSPSLSPESSPSAGLVLPPLDSKSEVARPRLSSFCTACSAMYHGAAVVALRALTAPGL